MIVALCPTFRRPRLAANAAACFLAQRVDLKTRLLVWEDGGAFLPGQCGSIKVVTSRRLPNLGAKYNALARLAIDLWDADYLAVWEDDDIYLPNHLKASVLAMVQTGRAWSKPSQVLSLYTGKLQEEPAAGRFHASIVLSRRAWEAVHWPENGRADFDQQLFAELAQRVGPPADPLEVEARPQYVFRWGSTGMPHGQNFMHSPQDATWYQRAEKAFPEVPPEALRPRFDAETTGIFHTLKETNDG